MKIIYADNNAITQVALEVFEAMWRFSPTTTSIPARCTSRRDARRYVAAARETIARSSSATEPRQILFTSCATESNNTAIVGTAKAERRRRHIITTAVEHPAVWRSAGP